MAVVISLNRFMAPVDDTVTAQHKSQVTSLSKRGSIREHRAKENVVLSELKRSSAGISSRVEIIFVWNVLRDVGVWGSNPQFYYGSHHIYSDFP